MDFTKIIDKFNISSEREDYALIHDTVEKGIYFKGTNLWILIFAIFIACVGLNVNSTAVIIGAMLISPLMGPILGIGYGLATYEFSIFKKSLYNFGFAVLSSLSASTLYFLITPLNQAHSELLARTQPNIYDVIIALVGGLAGIVALSSKNKGNVIPGVAIATALMPPLCTAGYGLATANWAYFFGAFYLFTINTVFIALATLVTVRFLKYPIWNNTDNALKQKANRWVSIVVFVTLVPSIYFGYILVRQEQFNQDANSFVKNESHIEGDYLLKYEIDPSKRTLKLVYGGKPIPQNVKIALLAKCKHYGLESDKVFIQQGFSVDENTTVMVKSDDQQREINRLKSDLILNISRQDSLEQANQLGGKLIKELQSLFPEIIACGTSEQLLYDDSLKLNKYQVLFVSTRDIKKTKREQEKLRNWFKSRVLSDSVKVFIE
ncbi:DUF389 domain-containing protein [Pedobacter immunditicola]|uniref:DUF389 domain-containing protein n=1 Tax=Pedobacter immunditicola TaxID=3133440 RepID=UPI0030AA5FBC